MIEKLVLRRFDRYFAPPDRANSLLRPRDRGVACANLRRALCILGYLESTYERSGDEDTYDEEIWSAVRKFQKARRTQIDGLVGPVTRRLLISELLDNQGIEVFQRLQRPDPPPQVFMSYAWKDSAKVNKLDQWLRDKGIRVIRDQTDFAAGGTIDDSIRESIAVCDKVLAVYSANYSGREWPTLETFVAGELESVLNTKLLVYIRIDGTPLPERATGRLHIDARNLPLRVVGDRLLQAISATLGNPSRYEYDEDAPL